MKTNIKIWMLAGIAVGCSRARWARNIALALWMFIAMFTAAASAQQLNVPLYFGLSQAATDEYGVLLEGTAANPGALMQILAAPEGIFPPGPDGTPDPRNPVLAEARIGEGTGSRSVNPMGLAAGSVFINRQQGNRIFARVFNRPSLEDSSFYADSAMYENSTTTYGVFEIGALQTTLAVDHGDYDGDGLINSWERSLGTDPYLADSDGDGVSDYHEMLAGTDPLDDTDYLQMVQVFPRADGAVEVKWYSVAGKTYQVQHTTLDLMAPGAEFENVGAAITAVDDKTVAVITNLPGLGMQHFRVVLVE